MDEAVVSLESAGLRPTYRGKVREIFDLGDRLLLVATDRLSAFDCILPTGIPGKGRLLTAISVFWFRALEGILPTHFLTDQVSEFPEPFRSHEALLAGRSMLVRKARRIDVECVVRGYLAGSGLKDYRATGAVCGIALPAGLQEGEALPELIFTPARKNDSGHDENITISEAAALAGADTVAECRRLSLALYRNLARHAADAGLILADTKFEFGWLGESIGLIDEVGTPDSSRYWDAARYRPGSSPPSFDKQYVRDWLEASGWNKEPPAPALPDDVVARTLARYEEAAHRLIGGRSEFRFRPDVSGGEGAWRWS